MRTVFVLNKKTRQLRDLNNHIARIVRMLKAEERRMRKLLSEAGDYPDDHSLFMLIQVMDSMSWLEATKAFFEKRVDTLLEQDDDWGGSKEVRYCDGPSEKCLIFFKP